MSSVSVAVGCGCCGFQRSFDGVVDEVGCDFARGMFVEDRVHERDAGGRVAGVVDAVTDLIRAETRAPRKSHVTNEWRTARGTRLVFEMGRTCGNRIRTREGVK